MLSKSYKEISQDKAVSYMTDVIRKCSTFDQLDSCEEWIKRTTINEPSKTHLLNLTKSMRWHLKEMGK